MRLQTPSPGQLGIPAMNGVSSQVVSKAPKGTAAMQMNELDPRIKLRSSLRCDGIGRLDCAEDLESGQRLAVRWLPLDANGEAAVKACERLPVHPMLPRIRQTGRMGSMAFLALDFPEGSLLSTILGDRLDTGVVLQMASQLADALATVHNQGVVHGEFGSDSVLMVGDKSYLWDLPLVIANRLTDRRGENRLMQNLVRVVPYLAPERARGAGASCEADVYSLGALLCICAGAPMPADSTTLGTVYSIAQGQWVPRVPSTIPQPFHGMIEKMISADATERPAAQDVAKLFATPMQTGSLPTVPDMPMIRLPPELQARANALLKAKPVMPALSEPLALDPLPLGEPEREEISVTAAMSVEVPAMAEPPVEPMAVHAVEVAPVELAPVVAAAAVEVAPVEVAPVVAAPVETSVEVAPAMVAPAVVEPEVKAAEVDEVPEAATNDVVKLPTIEMPKVLRVESMVVPPPASAPRSSVALSESVSVSPEMMRDGAAVFSMFSEPPKQSMTMWWVAGGLVVAIVAMLVLALSMVGGSTAEHAAPAAMVAPVPAKVEAAPAVVAPAGEAAPGVVPAPVAPAPANEVAPAAKPESTKLSPAKPRTEEMVDMGGNDDELAPLAKAKAAVAAPRAAPVANQKGKHAKAVKAAFPVMVSPSATELAAQLVAPPAASAPIVEAPAPAAAASAASPDAVFDQPVKETRAESKKPNP